MIKERKVLQKSEAYCQNWHEMHFERIRKYKDDKVKVADGGKFKCEECFRCDGK